MLKIKTEEITSLLLPSHHRWEAKDLNGVPLLNFKDKLKSGEINVKQEMHKSKLQQVPQDLETKSRDEKN